MDPLSCRITYDGGKNTVLQVQGVIGEDILEHTRILQLSDLTNKAEKVRIESVVFAIQEKMGCILWWKVGDTFEPIVPLESRGMLDFERHQGLHSPREGVEGIYMTTFGCNGAAKYILFLVDISKQ